MKRLIAAAVVLMSATPAYAAIKPCEELKAEVDAKLQAKGVKGYTLGIVPSENVKEEKVVGSCDGGTKKIVYKREK